VGGGKSRFLQGERKREKNEYTKNTEEKNQNSKSLWFYLVAFGVGEGDEGLLRWKRRGEQRQNYPFGVSSQSTRLARPLIIEGNGGKKKKSLMGGGGMN